NVQSSVLSYAETAELCEFESAWYVCFVLRTPQGESQFYRDQKRGRFAIEVAAMVSYDRPTSRPGSRMVRGPAAIHRNWRAIHGWPRGSTSCVRRDRDVVEMRRRR